MANDKVGICVISLVLDRRHLKSDNKYPIALRFTIDRKRLYYSLGEKYTEKEFDAICRAKNTGRRTSTKNERETNFERKVQLERTFKSYVDIVQDLDKTAKLSLAMIMTRLTGKMKKIRFCKFGMILLEIDLWELRTVMQQQKIIYQVCWCNIRL